MKCIAQTGQANICLAWFLLLMVEKGDALSSKIFNFALERAIRMLQVN
jgi:hypothetical protein